MAVHRLSAPPLVVEEAVPEVVVAVVVVLLVLVVVEVDASPLWLDLRLLLRCEPARMKIMSI